MNNMKTNNIFRQYHFIIGLIGLVLVIIFTLQNTEVVTVRLLFWKLEMSRVILILVVLLIGMLVGYILGAHKRKTDSLK